MGTPEDIKRRKKDLERKQLSRGLKVFDKMALFANQYEDVTYFAVIKKGNDVHFTGSSELVKKFKDNEKLLEYTDSMIETRQESIIKKITKTRVKQQAVRPSPYKASSATMSFLPEIKQDIKQAQQIELKELRPSENTEDLISITKDTVLNLKSRIFTREKRKPVKRRLEEIACEQNAEGDETKEKPKKRGRPRGRGKGRK